MATANFTECGNHGLFIIDSEKVKNKTIILEGKDEWNGRNS